MRISDWSSDVCSSDLVARAARYREGEVERVAGACCQAGNRHAVVQCDRAGDRGDQGLPGIAGAERIAARGLPGEVAGLGTAAAELQRIADGSGAGFGLSDIAADRKSTRLNSSH